MTFYNNYRRHKLQSWNMVAWPFTKMDFPCVVISKLLPYVDCSPWFTSVAIQFYTCWIKPRNKGKRSFINIKNLTRCKNMYSVGISAYDILIMDMSPIIEIQHSMRITWLVHVHVTCIESAAVRVVFEPWSIKLQRHFRNK